ncbi:potassium-transporting ATPase subunit KdpC [Streptantibioticus rubrisoli]|uniref:Potassium-transporting ATPase KdpC subunit n=1 Tax=Streptantibioticus rubrisoli TaxID=1387313 RepID=A0ABT1PHF7_9ACTN|nr:potassium-transporting ATPase subunit KdpC [Streptantibioticus rubrisoli]MCQ4044784.1 potassium-transporting ATPase subunit KdpC [Streptantibioticus rubrisoli]
MNNSFRNSARLAWAALRALLVLTVVTGVIYPLAVWGVAQAAFNGKANGSQVKVDGKVVGSSLLGQNFNLPKKNPSDANETAQPDPKWFQPRPSAAGTDGYDTTASGASNLGPSNPKLVQTVNDRRKQVAEFNGVSPSQVPVDAVTASGSGLDPDISPEYAKLQVDRVAKARHLDPAKVAKLVADHTDGRQLGFLGEPTVNVLELNIALQQLAG